MARGLLNDPWILFLDEPTLGLDVAAAGPSATRARLEGGGTRPDGPAYDALHDRGRRTLRPDRDRRPRPDPSPSARPTSSRRASSGSRSSGSRSTTSTAGRRPSPGCRAWCPRPLAGVRLGRTARRVAVNLVLKEDGVLGGVVRALGGDGSQILALRKSEPTLEDVFVELVGRGFQVTRPKSGRDGAGRHPEASKRRPMPTRPANRPCGVSRTRAAGRTRGPPPTGPAATWPRTTPRSLVGRAYPRVRGMVREPSWLFFEILLPFLTTSAFVLVYRALQAPRGLYRLRRARRGDGRRSGSMSSG